MKNKYQEVLDVIKKINLRSEHYVQFEEDNIENVYEEEINIIQELVDEKIPVKVVKWKLAQPETRCSKCGAGLERYHDYCWGCGRKVDWSDYDEN